MFSVITFSESFCKVTKDRFSSPVSCIVLKKCCSDSFWFKSVSNTAAYYTMWDGFLNFILNNGLIMNNNDKYLLRK
jgi:hypothetical protein